MDTPYKYEIRIEAKLTDRWSDWFDGLTIHHDTSEETVLSGMLPDQAALFGLLMKIHDLNLVLISVSRIADLVPKGT